MAARSTAGFSRRNQSLIAVVHRWCRPIVSDHESVNVFDLKTETTQAIAYGLIIALGLLFLASTRLKSGKNSETRVQDLAMVLILCVLCSPLAWTYFYCWLLPAWAIIVKACQKDNRYLFPATLSGILLVSALSEQFDHRLQAYGVTAAGALGMYLTIALIRFRSFDSEPES